MGVGPHGNKSPLKSMNFKKRDTEADVGLKIGAEIAAIDRFSPTLCLIAALILGMSIGWLDLHVEEVQWSVLLMLVLGAVLGYVCARFAWLWALVIGLCIPVAHLIGRFAGVHPIIPPSSFGWTFLALVPSFLGTYAGALARILSRPGH
jgi:hypothetical protein